MTPLQRRDLKIKSKAPGSRKSNLTLDRTESPWLTLLDAFLSADFDEQTADDWDVDMSVYYDAGTGPEVAVLGGGMVPWPCRDTLPDLLSRG